MKTKLYEYTCDVCGAVTHTRGGSNAEIRRYDWIVSGNKHYCSKECYNEDKGRNRSAQKNVGAFQFYSPRRWSNVLHSRLACFTYMARPRR